jgi:hypothetical protein
MPTTTARNAADRRRDLYEQRIAAATTLRARMNALVGWLMSEVYQRPDEWFGRLHETARSMNERNRRHDGE